MNLELPELHDSHVIDYEFAVVYADDEPESFAPYRPCCCCGEEGSERDAFMNRFICGPCWTAEDDAVADAERRSNRSLC